MAHECIQTRRLFIIERDQTNECAKHEANLNKIHETLEAIGKAIASLGSNVNDDMQLIRKDIASLSKAVKKKA
jgi:hypothetical protein